MQDARDSFYVALRDTLMAGNPARMISLRGQLRPAVLVQENELETAEVLDDTFVLQWTALTVSAEAERSVAKMECELGYGTRGNGPLIPGSAAAGELGRGRALATMDAELNKALVSGRCAKQSFVGMSVSGALVGSNGVATSATAPMALGSQVWWGAPRFGVEADADGRVSRVTTVSVWTVLE
jgi:hypothetical protein